MRGSCSKWKTISTSIAPYMLPSSSFSTYLSSISWIYSSLDTTNFETKNISSTCKDKNVVFSFLFAIFSQSEYIGNCGNDLWKVSLCVNDDLTKIAKYCVNCTDLCNETSNAIAPLSLYPCPSCSTNKVSYSILSISTQSENKAPILSLPLKVTTYMRSLSVQVNITSTGICYCNAYIKGSLGTNTSLLVSIKQAGFSESVQNAGLVYILINNLVPNSAYSVYCYTENSQGNRMSLSSILNTERNVRTLCCRQINLQSPFTRSIAFGSSFSKYTFQLDSLPTTLMTVNVSVISNQNGCAYGRNSSLDRSSVIPQSFLFSPSSFSISGSFLVYGLEIGCYVLSLSASDKSYDNYTTSLSVYSVSNIKNDSISPSEFLAYLSQDGQQISISFDSPTDQGGSKYLSSTFNCGLLLYFSGSSLATCRWTSNTTIISILSGLYKYENLNFSISIVPKAIKSYDLYSGSFIGYINSTLVVTVIFPLNPSSPIISLSVPNLISKCDNIVIDATKTSGPSNLRFRSIKWYVSGSGNSSTINKYLTSFTSLSSPITVSNSFFSAGDYTIGLIVENLLMKSSTAEVKIKVLTTSSPYTVRINGPSVVVLNRSQPLSLFANVVASSCNGSTSLTTPVTYVWSVYQDGLISSSFNVISTSKDVRYFILPSYSFDLFSSYTIQVTVSSTLGTGVASVVVQVVQSGITASIKRGGYQSVPQGGSFTLDGSESFSNDYPLLSQILSYKWSCKRLALSNFGSSCNSALTNSTSALATFLSSNLTNTNTINDEFEVTLYISDTLGQSASTSIKITISQSFVPSIQFAAINTKYNPQSKILISASISCPLSTCYANWSISTLFANEISTSQVYYPSLKGSVTLQFAIKSLSLLAGNSYNLQLSAAYSKLSLSLTDESQYFSVSSVTIIANKPPSDGTISVNPTTGYTLTTTFLLQTSSWYSSSENLPLAYTFGYYKISTEKSILVKSRDQNQYINSALGQGLIESNYSITCQVIAYDIYDSFGSASTIVNVLPQNSSFNFFNFAQSYISKAFLTNDVNVISQTISSTVFALNAVNCSTKSEKFCSSINRQRCSSTSNTCGSCQSGYIGLDGDANTLCFLPESAKSVSSLCTSNQECITSLCVDGRCGFANKLCPNNCTSNENGRCIFQDVSSLKEVSSCAQGNLSCQATCICSQGFFGGDCSLTESTYEVSVKARRLLCSSLLQLTNVEDAGIDVISARALQVSYILNDLSIVDDSTYSNCSTAIVQTLSTLSSITGSYATTGYVMQAISSVLAKGNSISATLHSNLSQILGSIGQIIQNNIAIGEVEYQTYQNIRLVSTLSNVNDADSLGINVRLSLAQTDFEKYNNIPVSQAAINISSMDSPVAISRLLSGDDVLGSTLFDMTGLQYESEESRSLSLQSVIYHSYQYTSDLLTETGGDDSDLVIKQDLVLVNKYPKIYSTNDSSIDTGTNRTFTCPLSFPAVPRNHTVNCTGFSEPLVFLCPGNAILEYEYSCPIKNEILQCRSFSQSKGYQADEVCYTKSFSEMNTTCSCNVYVNNLYARRRLLEVDSAFEDKRSLHSVHLPNSSYQFYGRKLALQENGKSSVKEFSSGTDTIITAAPVPRVRRTFITQLLEYNLIITSTMCVVLSILLLGVFGFATLDVRMVKYLHTRKSDDKYKDGSRKQYGPKKAKSGHGSIFGIDSKKEIRNSQNEKEVSSDLNDGFVNSRYKHSNENDMSMSGKGITESFTDLQTLNDPDILPIELSFSLTWYARFIKKLTLEHDWIYVMSSYGDNIPQNSSSLSIFPLHPFRESRTVRWLKICGKVLHIMCITTVLARIFFADNGSCNDFLEESTCTHSLKFYSYYHYCRWDPSVSSCAFNSDMNTASLLILVSAILLLIVPLDKMFGWFLFEAKRLSQDVIISRLLPNRRHIVAGASFEQLSPRMNEEFVSSEKISDSQRKSMKTSILRIARVQKLIATYDSAGPETEAEILISQYNKAFGSTIENDKKSWHESIRLFFLGIYHRIYLNDWRSVRLGPEGLSSQLTQSLVIHHVKRARLVANHLDQDISNIETIYEKEIFLLQHFLIECLSGYQRRLAMSYFPKIYDSIFTAKPTSPRTSMNRDIDYALILHYTCAIFLPFYCCILIFLIFFIGSGIGTRATYLWCFGCLVSLVIDILVLQPLKIWFKYLILPAFVKDIFIWQRKLSYFAREILQREKGLVIGVSKGDSMIQHFNPACRTARSNPTFPTSKLIYSLTDNDLWEIQSSVPSSFTAVESLKSYSQKLSKNEAQSSITAKSNKLWRIIMKPAIQFVEAILAIVTLLPLSVQDLVFESCLYLLLSVSVFFLSIYPTDRLVLCLVFGVLFVLIMIISYNTKLFSWIQSFVWGRSDSSVHDEKGAPRRPSFTFGLPAGELQDDQNHAATSEKSQNQLPWYSNAFVRSESEYPINDEPKYISSRGKHINSNGKAEKSTKSEKRGMSFNIFSSIFHKKSSAATYVDDNDVGALSPQKIRAKKKEKRRDSSQSQPFFSIVKSRNGSIAADGEEDDSLDYGVYETSEQVQNTATPYILFSSKDPKSQSSSESGQHQANQQAINELNGDSDHSSNSFEDQRSSKVKPAIATPTYDRPRLEHLSEETSSSVVVTEFDSVSKKTNKTAKGLAPLVVRDEVASSEKPTPAVRNRKSTIVIPVHSLSPSMLLSNLSGKFSQNLKQHTPISLSRKTVNFASPEKVSRDNRDYLSPLQSTFDDSEQAVVEKVETANLVNEDSQLHIPILGSERFQHVHDKDDSDDISVMSLDSNPIVKAETTASSDLQQVTPSDDSNDITLAKKFIPKLAVEEPLIRNLSMSSKSSHSSSKGDFSNIEDIDMESIKRPHPESIQQIPTIVESNASQLGGFVRRQTIVHEESERVIPMIQDTSSYFRRTGSHLYIEEYSLYDDDDEDDDLSSNPKSSEPSSPQALVINIRSSSKDKIVAGPKTEAVDEEIGIINGKSRVNPKEPLSPRATVDHVELFRNISTIESTKRNEQPNENFSSSDSTGSMPNIPEIVSQQSLSQLVETQSSTSSKILKSPSFVELSQSGRVPNVISPINISNINNDNMTEKEEISQLEIKSQPTVEDAPPKVFPHLTSERQIVLQGPQINSMYTANSSTRLWSRRRATVSEPQGISESLAAENNNEKSDTSSAKYATTASIIDTQPILPQSPTNKSKAFLGDLNTTTKVESNVKPDNFSINPMVAEEPKQDLSEKDLSEKSSHAEHVDHVDIPSKVTSIEKIESPNNDFSKWANPRDSFIGPKVSDAFTKKASRNQLVKPLKRESAHVIPSFESGLDNITLQLPKLKDKNVSNPPDTQKEVEKKKDFDAWQLVRPVKRAFQKRRSSVNDVVPTSESLPGQSQPNESHDDSKVKSSAADIDLSIGGPLVSKASESLDLGVSQHGLERTAKVDMTKEESSRDNDVTNKIAIPEHSQAKTVDSSTIDDDYDFSTVLVPTKKIANISDSSLSKASASTAEQSSTQIFSNAKETESSIDSVLPASSSEVTNVTKDDKKNHDDLIAISDVSKGDVTSILSDIEQLLSPAPNRSFISHAKGPSLALVNDLTVSTNAVASPRDEPTSSQVESPAAMFHPKTITYRRKSSLISNRNINVTGPPAAIVQPHHPKELNDEDLDELIDISNVGKATEAEQDPPAEEIHSLQEGAVKEAMNGPSISSTAKNKEENTLEAISHPRTVVYKRGKTQRKFG